MLGMPKALAKLVFLLTPNRRWARFSLGTMFVVVTGLCVWLAIVVNRAHRQRDAVAAIKVWGGRIEFDDERRNHKSSPLHDGLRVLLGDDDAAHVVRVRLPSNWETMERKFEGTFMGRSHVTSGPVVDDDGLRKVAELASLQNLTLSWTDIGDAGMANLQGLTNLNSLGLHYTNVTDDGLLFLAGMSRLDSLDLSGTKISDRGLARLKPLENLQSLSLHTTSVTSSGVEHLVGLPKLESLQLAYTKVDDDCVDNLARITSLTYLDIRYTGISDDGRARLTKALPGCSISRLSDSMGR